MSQNLREDTDQINILVVRQDVGKALNAVILKEKQLFTVSQVVLKSVSIEERGSQGWGDKSLRGHE